MALRQFTYSKGPEGATYAIADDGALLKTVTGNGPIIYTADSKPRQGFTVKGTLAGTSANLIRYSSVGTVLAVSVWLKATLPGIHALTITTATDGAIVRIEKRPDTGLWAMVSASGVAYPLGTTASDSPLGVWNRFDFSIEIGASTTTGKINAKRYNQAGAQVGPTVAVTTANLGTTEAGRLNVGSMSNNGVAGESWQAYDLQIDEGTTTIPAPIVDPPPPVITNPRIPVGIKGDSKANQDGTGEAAFDAAFAAKGWAAADVRTSGVNSRVPWGEDSPPSTQTTWNAWKAEGFDPKLLVLILGANIRNSSQATWEFQFGQLFNMIDDGSRRIFAVNLAYKDPAVGAAFNAWHKTWIQARPNAQVVDYNAMIRAREAAGQPVTWNADNIHMVPGATGYDLLNNLIASDVQTYVDGLSTPAPALAAIAAQNVAAGATVTVTAVPTGTVTGYTWRQVSGPQVTLTGSGASRSFVAPSEGTASTVVLGVVASNGGSASSERQATVNVAATTGGTVQPVLQTISFDGTNGAALTLANSGTTPQAITGGNRAIFSTDAALFGPTGALFEKVEGGNTAGALTRTALTTARNLVQFGGYWKADATIPPAVKGIVNFRTGSARLLSIARDANLGLYPLDRVNASAGGSLLANTAITAGRWYYITGWVKVGTTSTNGEYHLRVYDTTTNALVASRDVTNADLGTEQISVVDVGTINNVNHITRLDVFRFGDQAAELAPYVFAEPAPTVGDIAARTVEPLTTVLTVADVTGTTTGYTWRQVSGPTVTLTGTGASRSFKAPASALGTTVVLGVRAVNGAAQSAEKTASITVRPHLSWVLRGGVWVPVGPRRKVGAA